MATVDIRGLAGSAPLEKVQNALPNLPEGSPVQVVGDSAEAAAAIKEFLNGKGVPFQELQVDNSEWVLYFNR